MDYSLLREAIAISIEKMEANEGGPFGAVVVRHGKIIGRGWNKVTSTNDPTAHAEIVAIRDACANLKTYSLAGCEIYASCEPCPMCLAAVYWARIERLYFAASSADAAEAGFDDCHIYHEISKQSEHRKITIVQALRDEAQQAFHRWNKKEDRIRY